MFCRTRWACFTFFRACSNTTPARSTGTQYSTTNARQQEKSQANAKTAAAPGLSEYLDYLEQQSIPARITTYAYLLRECGNKRSLVNARRVHAHIVKSGLRADVLLGNQLILMYKKCKRLTDARDVFDKMSSRNVASWNAIISVYSQDGHVPETLQLFQQMQQHGSEPDKITYLSSLGACFSKDALPFGKLVHAHVIGRGSDSDISIKTALMCMYARCGSINDARMAFENMQNRDVVSWTSMISIYAERQFVGEAFKLFQQMQQVGMVPDKITYITILDACASPNALGLGKVVHAQICYREIQSDILVGTALVNMYGKCGSMKDARRTFDNMTQRDVVTWTTIITAYAHNGYSKEAFQIFEEMQQEGISPNKVTFISILSACDCPEDLAFGKLVHAQIVDGAIELDIFIGTALTNMYGKCGSMEDAARTFNKMPQRNVFTWNAVIGGCVQHGHNKAAFKYFQQMQHEHLVPNQITFVNILNTCAGPESLQVGRLLHFDIIERGFESDVVVGTALVNMYGKCGGIKDAERIFNRMPERNVFSWTAIISAYAQHGHGEKAIEIFRQMQREGARPNGITFIGILNACSHAGLVDGGLTFFESMSIDYGITPTLEHYNCIIDLLGRAGQLDDAEEFIKKMPFQPDAVIWMTLLSSCRIHGFIEHGKHAAEYAFHLNPQFWSTYVVLSNIYAAVGRWKDASKMRKLMADKTASLQGRS